MRLYSSYDTDLHIHHRTWIICYALNYIYTSTIHYLFIFHCCGRIHCRKYIRVGVLMVIIFIVVLYFLRQGHFIQLGILLFVTWETTTCQAQYQTTCQNDVRTCSTTHTFFNLSFDLCTFSKSFRRINDRTYNDRFG